MPYINGANDQLFLKWSTSCTACYTEFSNRVTLQVQFNEFVCYRMVSKPIHRNGDQRAISNDDAEIKLIVFTIRT